MTDTYQKFESHDSVSKILGILEPLDEANREKVLAAVRAYFQPMAYQRPQPPIPPPPDAQPSNDQTVKHPQPLAGPKDIRTLKDEKQPKTDMEMAAVMAYYLKELAPPAERKDSVSAQEVNTYFVQAGYRLPSTPRQTLRNAKNAGYFEAAGRGKFRLNPVGHNLVTHSLPKSGSDVKPKAKRKKSPTAQRKKTSRKSRATRNKKKGKK